MYRIAIYERNVRFATMLRSIIQEESQKLGRRVDINIDIFDNSSDFANANLASYDSFFIDVSKNIGEDGNILSRHMRTFNKNAILVLSDDTPTPTPEHFKLRPYRFLVKSVFDEVLVCVQESLYEMIKMTKGKYIILGSNKKFYKVDIAEIVWVEREKNKVKVNYVENYLYVTNKTLKDLHEELSIYGFEYAHNSYIVNLSYVEILGKNEIILDDKNRTKLTISRTMKNLFHEKYFSEYKK